MFNKIRSIILNVLSDKQLKRRAKAKFNSTWDNYISFCSNEHVARDIFIMLDYLTITTGKYDYYKFKLNKDMLDKLLPILEDKTPQYRKKEILDEILKNT